MTMLHTIPASAPLLRTTFRLAILAALLGGLIGLAPLTFGETQGADPNHLRIGVGAYGVTQRLEVGLNKSLIVDLPADVHEVIVSQPGVAGAIMRNKRRAIVQGIGSGETNVFFLDGAGEAIAVLDLAIKPQRSDVATLLASTLRRVLPGSSIQVEAIDVADSGTSRVVLSGYAESADDIAKAIQIASQFAGGEGNVASVLTTSSPQQVMLKVTIAEVNRETVKQLGINLDASFSAGVVDAGLRTINPLGGASQVLTANQATFDINAGNFSLETTLRALERRGAVRTLAEPTLTAISGQEAEFMAGGEFPVPTGTDENDRITFEYKEFGPRLTFTPTVKSNGTIALTVQTSVTEPTPEGSLSVAGLTIPGIKRREARTSVELGAGQTLAIGGLLQDSTRAQINKFPGLGDIPIIGVLFRSRDYIHAQTELVVLVTPELAFPADAYALPTDGMVMATDAEQVFLGRLESMYGVGDDGMRGSYDGHVGFVLD